MNESTEYQAFSSQWQQAELGGFLVVPLKYDAEEFDFTWLETHQDRRFETFFSDDLNSAVLRSLNSAVLRHSGSCEQTNVFRRFRIPAEVILAQISQFGSDHVFYACKQQEGLSPEASLHGRNPFTLEDADVYVFHTQVAFLCIRLRFQRMETLETICSVGYVRNDTVFGFRDSSGAFRCVDFDAGLLCLCRQAGMELFYNSDASVFLDSYAYTVARIRQRPRELDTLRQATFNLHQFADLSVPVSDGSEADINYVYALKDQQRDSYGWGYCISSQTICYLVANDRNTMDEILGDQAENGLPLVMLALYQKYTCLRFQTLLAQPESREPARIRALKTQLMEFKAYGTIPPANISRWHNITQIYRHMMTENEIPDAIEKMSLSIQILADRQKELEDQKQAEADARETRLVNLVTIFSVLSVPSSVAELVECLCEGLPIYRAAAALSLVAMLLILRRMYRKK